MSDAEKIVAAGLCSVDEAVKFLRLGRSDLYARMEKGELASVKIGRRRLIPKQAMIDFAAKHIVNRKQEHEFRQALPEPQGLAETVPQVEEVRQDLP